MAHSKIEGGKKGKYEDFHTGGQGDVAHGSRSGGVGGHYPNQDAPKQEFVNRVPSDADQFDENFSNGC